MNCVESKIGRRSILQKYNLKIKYKWAVHETVGKDQKSREEAPPLNLMPINRPLFKMCPISIYSKRWCRLKRVQVVTRIDPIRRGRLIKWKKQSSRSNLRSGTTSRRLCMRPSQLSWGSSISRISKLTWKTKKLTGSFRIIDRRWRSLKGNVKLMLKK